MSFKTARLMGSRVHVMGTDVNNVTGETVLDSTQWDEVTAHKQYSKATEDFDTAVEEFFAPLLDAAEKAQAILDEKKDDPTSYVVYSEAVEGVPAKPAHLVKLTRDSIILRLIEDGTTDRLVWVGGELEVLAPQVHAASGSVDVLSGDA